MNAPAAGRGPGEPWRPPGDGAPPFRFAVGLSDAVYTEKHAYHDGEILAMSGGSPDQALLTANVIAALNARLKAKPCHVYASDLGIDVPASRQFVYPDASVVCGPREIHPEDPARQSVVNPRLIVEVLSPSTEAYDRGDKFAHYG